MQLMTARGTVRGGAIWLDKAVPGLEGKLVEVKFEVVEDTSDVPSTPEVRGEAWSAWIEHGPQGPIVDDDGADWP